MKVLAEPSGAERSAQFVRPTLRFVALIRVDSLEGAAVELGVAGRSRRRVRVGRPRPRPSTGRLSIAVRGTRLTPLSRSVWEDADRVDCARHFPRNRLTASRPAWGASSATIESGSMDAALGPAISSVSTGMFPLDQSECDGAELVMIDGRSPTRPTGPSARRDRVTRFRDGFGAAVEVQH